MSTQRVRAENLAGLIALSLLAVGCFVVLRTFLAAILWALILTIAIWPSYHQNLCHPYCDAIA